jgi:cytochrome c
VLFDAAHPDREWRELLGERDADGKQFLPTFIDVVSRFGSGWVDCMFPKPGRSPPTVEGNSVREIQVDGVDARAGAVVRGA